MLTDIGKIWDDGDKLAKRPPEWDSSIASWASTNDEDFARALALQAEDEGKTLTKVIIQPESKAFSTSPLTNLRVRLQVSLSNRVQMRYTAYAWYKKCINIMIVPGQGAVIIYLKQPRSQIEGRYHCFHRFTNDGKTLELNYMRKAA